MTKKIIIAEQNEDGTIDRAFAFPIPAETSFPAGYDSIVIGETYPDEVAVRENKAEAVRSYVADNADAITGEYLQEIKLAVV